MIKSNVYVNKCRAILSLFTVIFLIAISGCSNNSQRTENMETTLSEINSQNNEPLILSEKEISSLKKEPLKQSEYEIYSQSYEPLFWSVLTDEPFIIVEISSINDDVYLLDDFGKRIKYTNFNVNIIFHYPFDKQELSTISELFIVEQLSNQIVVGDILFIEPVIVTNLNYKLHYGVKESNAHLHLLPIIGGRVVLTEKFTETDMFLAIKLYNEEIDKYNRAMNRGASFYMSFDIVSFYDGMTIDEIRVFFESMQKARIEYEAFYRQLRR